MKVQYIPHIWLPSRMFSIQVLQPHLPQDLDKVCQVARRIEEARTSMIKAGMEMDNRAPND